MRRAALALVVGALLAAAPAPAYDRPPVLERVASYFADRSAEVRCPSLEEWTSDPIWGTEPNPQRAWGYTDMVDEHILLHPALCAGALAVPDATVPAWQRATGVLVLIHEAYHLRRWKWRRSEARVECQAIQHFTSGAELLGASAQLANDLPPTRLPRTRAWSASSPTTTTADAGSPFGRCRSHRDRRRLKPRTIGNGTHP
jgi:hypothetical protein